MDREQDAKGNQKNSAKHISMELTADSAHVTSLSLRGSRLILTIEAELADSQLNSGAEMQPAAETASDSHPSPQPVIPSTDTQMLADDTAKETVTSEIAHAPEPAPQPEPPTSVAAEPKTAVVHEDALLDTDESIPGFADGKEEATSGISDEQEEDVMGALSSGSYQEPTPPETVAPENSVSVPPLAPEPPHMIGEPEFTDKPSVDSPSRSEAFPKPTSLEEPGIRALKNVPGFTSSPSIENHAPVKPITADPGFAPPQPAIQPPPAPPKLEPALQGDMDDSPDTPGFAPAHQDNLEPTNPVYSAPEDNKADPGEIQPTTDNSARIVNDEPSAPAGAQSAGEPQNKSASMESGRNLWSSEPLSPLADATDIGSWDTSAPKKNEPPASAETREPAPRENWDVPIPKEPEPQPAEERSNWGDNEPGRVADLESATPKPATETWEQASLAADSLPAISEESSVVGGERHGEPQPAMTYGVATETPAPVSDADKPIAHEAQPQPAPQGEKKNPEPGGTTVLIRYTCPKCKTQGMQAVDKVGTVVNCSNCSKAMRLVMKK